LPRDIHGRNVSGRPYRSMSVSSVETSAKVSCWIAGLGCPDCIEAQAGASTLRFDEEG
jgi:hypothetical protein